MKRNTFGYNDAARLLLAIYLKVLKVDIENDTFEEVKVIESETSRKQGYYETLSEWFCGFALAGNVYSDDIPEYMQFTSREVILAKLAAGKDKLSVRYRRKCGDEFRWVRMTLCKSAEYTEEKKLLILYVEDIQEDMESARKIEQQQQRLVEQGRIMESLVDMYFTCLYVDAKDNSYRRIYVVPEFEKYVAEKGNMWDVVMAYTSQLVIPDEMDDFQKKFSMDYICEMLKKQNSYDYEYWAKMNGKSICCRICAILVDRAEDGTPHHIIVAMQNVTPQAESAAQTNALLRDAFSAAVAASSAKSEFVSRMSHDIRTPLNGIIGMTAIAGAHLDERERIAECLTKITGASKHLLSLINDILDLSKIESGKVSLSEEEFNLPEMLDNLLGMLRASVEERHHKLNIYIEGITHENVIGDKLHLQRVFLNLISNAIKYTPDGGEISLTFREVSSGSLNLGQYQFICEDNGYGMSEEFLQKLFEPFERADDERVSNIQGTGLGMTITRNIVNMMGGDILVESKVGQGTKFTVTFKMKLQEAIDGTVEELLNLSVLVVDNDQSICESACLTLAQLGMKGDYALSGEAAIEKVRQAHERQDDYFACLIDWQMPGMDGLETTRRINEAVGSNVPVIIISAYDWDDIEDEARKAGADSFISKPLFRSRLYEAFTEIPKAGEEKRMESQLEEFHRVDYSAKRVLLVEDNDLNREIAVEIISSTGASVESAENGKVAVNLFQNSEIGYYDMIFMDVRMPVMDGYEATRAIRSLSREDAGAIPIVALTANAFVEDIAKAKQAGMNLHMSKPIELEKLFEVMKKCLGEKKSGKKLSKK